MENPVPKQQGSKAGPSPNRIQGVRHSGRQALWGPWKTQSCMLFWALALQGLSLWKRPPPPHMPSTSGGRHGEVVGAATSPQAPPSLLVSGFVECGGSAQCLLQQSWESVGVAFSHRGGGEIEQYVHDPPVIPLSLPPAHSPHKPEQSLSRN